MRYLRALLAALVVVATMAIAPSSPAQAQEPIEITEFYERLDPHGRWIDHPEYGNVWSPDTDADWRPYTRGRWAFTEEHGWLWESEEPFGWAVYHYGRWFLDEDLGWLWVPGTEWGPAWVAWRTSDHHVGWAPLPPEAVWRDDRLAFSTTYYDRPHLSPAWVFVPVAALTTYAIFRHVLPPRRNTVFLRSTTWVPRGHRSGSHGVFNAGYDRRRYETVTRRQITPVRIVTSDRPQFSAARSAAPGGSVQVFRPRIVGNVAATPPPRIFPRTELRQRNFGNDPRPQRAAPGSLPGQPRPDPSVGRLIQPQTTTPPQQQQQQQIVQPPPAGTVTRPRPLDRQQPPSIQGQPLQRTFTPQQQPGQNPPGTGLPPNARTTPPPDRPPVRQQGQPSFAPPPSQLQAQPRFLPPPQQQSPGAEQRARGPSGPPPSAGGGGQQGARSGPPPGQQGPPAGQVPAQKAPEKKKRPNPDGKEG